jgi:hypothetical protein
MTEIGNHEAMRQASLLGYVIAMGAAAVPALDPTPILAAALATQKPLKKEPFATFAPPGLGLSIKLFPSRLILAEWDEQTQAWVEVEGCLDFGADDDMVDKIAEFGDAIIFESNRLMIASLNDADMREYRGNRAARLRGGLAEAKEKLSGAPRPDAQDRIRGVESASAMESYA